MEEWLVVATRAAIQIIDTMALIAVAYGAVQAFVAAIGVALRRRTAGSHETRLAWLHFGRWLVAGLTFQLAADIVETAIAPTWQDVGQLGAIAVIRTFLNFFLERDLQEIAAREAEMSAVEGASSAVRATVE